MSANMLECFDACYGTENKSFKIVKAKLTSHLLEKF